VEGSAQGILKAAVSQMHLSARAYRRILKVARTVADLEVSPQIGAAHIAIDISLGYFEEGWSAGITSPLGLEVSLSVPAA